MGLFDKLKDAAKNAATEMKSGYEEASHMDIYELCECLKGLGKLEPKYMMYRAALSEKCHEFTEEGIEEFYRYILKQGTLLKRHPAQDVVEDVLVDRQLYVRNEDGTVSKVTKLKWFKK